MESDDRFCHRSCSITHYIFALLLISSVPYGSGLTPNFKAQCGLQDGQCQFDLFVPPNEVLPVNTTFVVQLASAVQTQIIGVTQEYNLTFNALNTFEAAVSNQINTTMEQANNASAEVADLVNNVNQGLSLIDDLIAEAATLQAELNCIANPAGCSILPETDRIDCHPDPGFLLLYSGLTARNEKKIMFVVGSSSWNMFEAFQEDSLTFYKLGVNEMNCLSRSCIFDGNPTSVMIPGAPKCYYPPGSGYKEVQSTSNPSTFMLTQTGTPSPFKQILQNIQLIQSFTQAEHTLRVQVLDQAQTARYRPPVPLPDLSYPYQCDKLRPCDNSLVFTTYATNFGTFAFKVTRNSTNTTLWDTGVEGSLMFSDQYIQIATYTPTRNVYGFGENTHQSLMHNMSRFKTWPMFARDEGPNSGFEDAKNLYGVHPFYICVEADGRAHGVLIMNSNAQEVNLGPGSNGRGLITYRTIGGILDIYFFPGPQPDQVIKQYLSLIGRPMLPAYWGLGFQLSRWGYNTIENVKALIDRTEAAGLPQETQVFDIDYMDHRKDFTYSATRWHNISNFVDNFLHQKGIHLITILDPAIDVTYQPFLDGQKNNIFVEWNNDTYLENCVNQTHPVWVCPLNNVWPTTKGTNVMLGTVWPEANVAFPDWIGNKPAATQWWLNEIDKFYQNVKFDGLWIDMNEPANFATNNPDAWYFTNQDLHHSNISMLFCPPTKWEEPPYETWASYGFRWNGWETHLYNKTLCMSAKQGQYRSTFVSSGRYTGHWLGDNNAGWDDMRTSIIGSIEFNWFGITYIGADVCGFNSDSEAELCLRWQQLGAFHPFFRNHNAIGRKDQDPASFGGIVVKAAAKAINFRYHYLPYLYTLMYRAHAYGETVIRPLWFDFGDNTSLTIDKQFTWGGGLLITPVLTPGVSTVQGWFPKTNVPGGGPFLDVFYSIYDFDYGLPVNTSGPSGGYLNLKAPNTSMIPVHVRAAKIYPRQAPALRLREARKNPLEFLIVPDASSQQATGDLFWDDGEAIDQESTAGYENFYYFRQHYFQNATLHQSKLQIRMFQNGSNSGVSIPSLDVIEIFNYPGTPNYSSFHLLNFGGASSVVNVSVDQLNSFYNPTTKVLTIHLMPGSIPMAQISMSAHNDTALVWNWIPPSTNPLIPENQRVDCHPEPGSTQSACLNRGCQYDDKPTMVIPGSPRCFYPSNTGYNLLSASSPITLEPTQVRSPFGVNINPLKFVHSTVTGTSTLHIQITDSTNARYEPPVPLAKLPYTCTACTTTGLTLSYTTALNAFFSFQIKRSGSSVPLFDTSVGGLIFNDQFIQIAAYTPTQNIYGWGENTHQTLKHDLSQVKTWALFARDEPPNSGFEDHKNLYGVHPFYLCVESNGSAHGVFIMNSNAQEYTLGPGPDGKGLLNYRFRVSTPNISKRIVVTFDVKTDKVVFGKNLDQLKNRIT